MSPFASAPRMADCIAYQRYADEVLAPQMERATLIRIKELEAEGKYDTEEMDPAYMEWMAAQFPNGFYLYCPDAGHMAMWDDPEGYHKGLADFINKV